MSSPVNDLVSLAKRGAARPQMEQWQPTDRNKLLQTKLAPPRLHAHLVERVALLAKVDEGLERKLTLLSAPAGCGKTTLVSQWLYERMKDEGGRWKERPEF